MSTRAPIPSPSAAKASGSRLRIVESRDETLVGREYPLDRPCLIGRAEECDIVLKDTSVSRRHARLTQRDEHYWLEDLNSVNLTYLNNQRLTPDRPAPLKDGDLLRLGRLLLTFRSE